MASCSTCKVQLETVSPSTSTESSVFSKSCTHLPKKFSLGHLLAHLNSSGKTVGVERPDQKGFKFFMEGYIHKVVTRTLSSGECEVYGHCYRSMRKNEKPHKLSVKIQQSGDVSYGHCSCVAGISGVCSHTFALLYTVNQALTFKWEYFKDNGTCTDSAQQWNAPKRKDGLHAEPIMNCTIVNTKYGKTSKGIKPTLHEARAPSVRDDSFGDDLFQKLKDSDRYLGFLHVYNRHDKYVKSVIGTDVQSGSILSYQTSVTEGYFSVEENFQCRQECEMIHNCNFPDVPIGEIEPVNIDFGDGQAYISNNLTVTKEQCVSLERKTRSQSECTEWQDARKSRVTASNFGLICKRRSITTKFVEGLANPKNLEHVQAIKYGRDNEPEAVKQYKSYMDKSGKPVSVYESGFVVNPSIPWAGCTPDRKVVDHKSGNVLVEVKCPTSVKELTPTELLKQENFYVSPDQYGKPTLDRNHSYYYQCQGQMGLCGIDFCDFVVYTKRGLLIERISFDKPFFDNMMAKLASFYKAHYLVYLTQTL